MRNIKTVKSGIASLGDGRPTAIPSSLGPGRRWKGVFGDDLFQASVRGRAGACHRYCHRACDTAVGCSGRSRAARSSLARFIRSAGTGGRYAPHVPSQLEEREGKVFAMVHVRTNWQRNEPNGVLMRTGGIKQRHLDRFDARERNRTSRGDTSGIAVLCTGPYAKGFSDVQFEIYFQHKYKFC